MPNNKYLVLLLTLFPLVTYSSPITDPVSPQSPVMQPQLPAMQPQSPAYSRPPESAKPRASSQKPLLTTVHFTTACGLPFFVQNGNYYFILSREAGGHDKGTFDDFGGKRDPGEDHPIISAAREFWEEAILTCVGLKT